MPASALKVLAVAAGEIGYDEGPNNSTKYAPAVGHANNQPWCATYVVWCFKQAGALDLLPNTSAYTPTSFQGFKNAGQSIPLDPKLWRPGDVVYFKWPGMGRIAHIGILEKVLGGGKIQVLEGNTNGAGSRTGGSVLRKVRDAKMIAGVGRPKYGPGGAAPAAAAPPKPAAKPKPWTFKRNLEFYQGPDIDAVRERFGLAPGKGMDEELARKVLAFRDKYKMAHKPVVDKELAAKLGAR